MAIHLTSGVFIGAFVGLALALIISLIDGIASNFISMGGLGSVGEKLTLRSFLANFVKPAIFLSIIGAVIALVIVNW